jgi:hypothetical protein
MTRRQLTVTLLALALASCSPWRPPPREPLEGWRETPSPREGVRELIRGTAVISELPIVPGAPADHAAHFADAATTLGHVHTAMDLPAAEEASVWPLRYHGQVTWVDFTFVLNGVRIRARESWYAVEDGTQVMRLVAPAADWNARDLTTFQEHVRHRAIAARLED